MFQFLPVQNFCILTLFWVSRYLLDTQQKVCKKVSKMFFYFQVSKNPLFYGAFLTYHNILYIFYHCHMDFSFRAFDGTFGLLRAFGSPFQLPRALEKPNRRYLKRYLKFKNQHFSNIFCIVIFLIFLLPLLPLFVLVVSL